MSTTPPGPTGPETGDGQIGRVAGKIFNATVSGLNGVGTIWIFMIMILINLDVFMRYLFNSPVPGVPLAVSMSIIAIVFLQLSDALRAGRFTRSDVMIGRLLQRRPMFGHALQLFYNALGVILMAIIFWYTIPFLGKAWRSNSYAGNEGYFTVPEWPVKLVILIGSAFCCVQFMRHFREDFRYLRGYRDNDHMGTGGIGDVSEPDVDSDVDGGTA
jgi:TRAP-type mannitol/chloroaromatic compound transport system permease small subunit